MPVAFPVEAPASLPLSPDRELRRHIDRCVSRALVDGNYARRLLNDPTVAVENHGCPPQHFKSLRNIHAIDLLDFAHQAYALFWGVEATSPYLEEQLPLAAAASR
jgi:hypothetical protein